MAHEVLVRDVRVWLEQCSRVYGGGSGCEWWVAGEEAHIAPLVETDALFIYRLPRKNGESGLAGATFHRVSKPKAQPEQAETALRDALQQIALEFLSYGYRRITAQLERRGPHGVNQVTQA